MRAIATLPLLLTMPAIAQEPWLTPGPHEWGHRYYDGTFTGTWGSLPHRVVVNYPATAAGADTPVAPGGPYPVIFFQHAGGSWYDNYDYLFSLLASRGFIVASADHDQVGSWSPDYWLKHEDLFHATIDLIQLWNDTPTWLTGFVDMDRMALAGHSHGCTALLCAMQDYAPWNPSAALEVRSIQMIAPCTVDSPTGPMADLTSLYEGMVPHQVIYGARDTDSCVAYGQAIAIYEPGVRPRHYVYVEGADHYAFTDAGSMGTSTITRSEAQRAAASAIVAWFEATLRADASALPALRGDEPLLTATSEITYQFHDKQRFVVDDFEDLAVTQTVAIAGFEDRVFVNGFLSDAFADTAAGVALVREQLARIYPTGQSPPYEVLYYEDVTLGTSVYELALTIEVIAGRLTNFTRITDSALFASRLNAGDGDVIVAAHQSSAGVKPHDFPLRTRICGGAHALLSDWRNLAGVGSGSAQPIIECANTRFDGEENWVMLESTGSLFSGTLAMINPGWGKSTVGLETDATVYGVSEAGGSAGGDPTINSLGLPVIAAQLATFDQSGAFHPSETLYSPTGALEVRDGGGALASFTEMLAAPGESFDASSWSALSFRLLQLAQDALNPFGLSQDLSVQLQDADGDLATLALSSAPQGSLRYPFTHSGPGWKSVFETYRFSLDAFERETPALDIDRLLSIAFLFDRTPTGTYYFDDIEFSSSCDRPAVGAPYCYGTSSDCPCDNPGAECEGCANSTGAGASLAGSGSASITADDLVLIASQVPPNQFGLMYMGSGQTQSLFGDGLRCIGGGGGIFRFPVRSSGNLGEIVLGPGIVAHSMATFGSGGHISMGHSWNFQCWFRDPLGPCGAFFNLSNGLAVTFQ